ncbi:MAG: hypothetical protein AMXMBFR44_1150 [Candidatus Campbellbacteria bacterium]
MSHLTINGKILDVGGDKKSGYHELISGTHTIQVANIKEGVDIDMTFDAQKPFPLKDESYDGVIMLNVLEHLFGYQNAVNESFRILKQGGVLVGSTPFLFNVHGSPDDYFRYTQSALERIFADAGFTEIHVSPLGTGAFSVLYHALFGLYRFAVVKEGMMLLVRFLDRVISWIKKDSHFSPRFMPLGYFFVVKK